MNTYRMNVIVENESIILEVKAPSKSQAIALALESSESSVVLEYDSIKRVVVVGE